MPSHQLLCFCKIFFYDLGKFLIRSASCKAHPFAKAFEMRSYCVKLLYEYSSSSSYPAQWKNNSYSKWKCEDNLILTENHPWTWSCLILFLLFSTKDLSIYLKCFSRISQLKLWQSVYSSLVPRGNKGTLQPEQNDPQARGGGGAVGLLMGKWGWSDMSALLLWVSNWIRIHVQKSVILSNSLV